MFRRIPFTENEIRFIEVVQSRPGAPGVKVFNTPVSARENMNALFHEKKPFWLPAPSEARTFLSDIYNDHLGRGRGVDLTDVFGIEWQYVPSAGGSMVRPGNPLLADANDWRDVIRIPDINKWDWEGAAEAAHSDYRYSSHMSFLNGFWFERLISFMDFQNAAVALIDDEQIDAIKDLFKATTELGCALVEKYCEYFPFIDGFNVHDDWGAQKAPFFSQDVAYDIFVPCMKQFTDVIHSKGRVATLHSCGHTEDRIEAYIDAGFDQWTPQLMNDCHALYEKYGDKMVIGVLPDEPIDFQNDPEEKQRRIAREFVEEYTVPGKPAFINLNLMRTVSDVFLEEVYRHSRKIYAER